ncbi:MAG TPA: hypothetical protein VIK47_07750 [Kiloniellales bacterium]
MTRLNNTRMPTLAAALAITAAIAIFSQANPASAARNVLSCEDNSRLKVIDCCQKIYNTRRPLWMMNGNASCRQGVTCKAGGRTVTGAPAAKRCWVRRIEHEPNDMKHTPDPKQPKDTFTRGGLI